MKGEDYQIVYLIDMIKNILADKPSLTYYFLPRLITN